MKFIKNYFNKSPNEPFSPKFEDIKIFNSISLIDKKSWNNLIGENNPFIEYEFLKAFENSNSIGERSGWFPYYITLFEGEELVGATFAYLKDNSYGEYIFDWSWASAYHKSGLQYYPKFVVSVPFTPATGKRLLVKQNENYEKNAHKLIDTLVDLGKSLKVSSIHWLFTEKNEQEVLKKKNFLARHTYQFHWKNNNYKTFDDFLAEFNSKKRNQIKRERRQANEGLDIQVLVGKDLKKEHWSAMYNLYISTTQKKWANDYLTKEFFQDLEKNFQENAVMILVNKNNQYIAGALNFRKNEHLYGRYWGCLEEYQCLHFEVCYYKAIEYAISENIVLFEAGAQGEHKLQRGFLPQYTYSAHWFENKPFYEAIATYLVEEKRQIDDVINQYKEIAPF